MSETTEASSRARLATLLRRQQAVSRAGDMFWSLTAACLVLACFMAIVGLADNVSLLMRAGALVVGVGGLFLGWRLARGALAMGRLKRDSARLTAMSGTEEIPGIGDVIAGRLSA